jgi:hypothetical protein
MSRFQECTCGSKQFPREQYDARGIFLCYTCPKCIKEKLSKYRPEFLTDSNYEDSEDIDVDNEMYEEDSEDIDGDNVYRTYKNGDFY